MSAPTRQLGKLSIGGMPTTRAQTQRGASVPYETEPRSDSESEEETSSSDEEVPSQPIARVVRGSTNIPYDLGGLSPAARGRVMHGLKGEFVVDRCCATRRGFDFDVADHGRVGLNDGSLVCSCRDFGQTNLACRHIYWLVDQLHRGFYPGLPPQAVRMSETGETQFFSRIAEMLGDKIEEIAKKRSWPYFPGVTSPADSSNGGPESMSRPQKARDILSAFSKSAMPDEFRPDLVETINQPRTPEQCVVQGDFEATMFRLAVHDENVYSGLRKVMPSGARADIFFDKIQARIRILFAEFDLYRETGAVRRDGTALEIPVVVEELKGRLDQIQRNILARSPHGSIGAAEALIHLLREVSTRNYDAFEDADWDRPVPAGEQEEERNLYLQLIDQSGHTDSFFVLDCLEILPDLVVRQWTPQLAAIFNAIHANGASLSYLRKLQALKAGVSGHKRPAAGLPGTDRKRTK
ncbi:uncharacterized protein CIMG_07516 [Coccidioides immitis RS]|uniref:SWIM-type domain-containing protein n=3 Tax=Coccidioides immitis TaxID=5501 RepID=J3K3J9_COCIM|nr:uncharacterized protein CIMG_07516 [Coccidioides immitis RS]EAS28770.3 hypothetical protein CIMG_07516 [Coccidioides immitis RS]